MDPKDKKLKNIILPNKVEGNYWITDGSEKERGLINIEGVDGRWCVTSNNNMKIIDNKAVTTIANEMPLVEDEKYAKYGIHKGETGCVVEGYAVDDCVLVDFSGKEVTLLIF